MNVSECKDVDDAFTCGMWVYKKSCKADFTTSITKCQKSCGFCNIIPDSIKLCHFRLNQNVKFNKHAFFKECVDVDDPFVCTLWALMGQCVTNPIYMIRNCCESCRLAAPVK